MTLLRVQSFSLSIDGFGAGPNQSLENPLGEGGHALHSWVFPTRTFQRMFGKDDGTTGTDDDFAARGFHNIGAWILGRNMFGPVRGPWPDGNWKGWWGDNPPYHTPVFVLTNHSREPLPMEGGTTFYFVTDGIVSALERATDAAQGLDGWAVAWPRSGNTYAPGLSMSCILPFRRSSSARERICSPILTCRRLASSVWNTSPQNKQCMWSSRKPGRRD
jgi:dihydrofolate reductase